MSRSGYSEDWGEDFNNQLELYRNSVDLALSGRRGQKFLKDLLAALDSMPQKRLIRYEFEKAGEVCALGAAGRAKGIDLPRGEMDEIDIRYLSRSLGVAPCMAREIMYENDDRGRAATPEQRFVRMRQWVSEKIAGARRIVR
jgi:hypothetical protein